MSGQLSSVNSEAYCGHPVKGYGVDLGQNTSWSVRMSPAWDKVRMKHKFKAAMSESVQETHVCACSKWVTWEFSKGRVTRCGEISLNMQRGLHGHQHPEWHEGNVVASPWWCPGRELVRNIPASLSLFFKILWLSHQRPRTRQPHDVFSTHPEMLSIAVKAGQWIWGPTKMHTSSGKGNCRTQREGGGRPWT